MEYILCAAIWYKELQTSYLNPKNVDMGVVICGHRHGHCIAALITLTGKRSVFNEVGEYEQGFLTNKNRFVSRNEAAKIARDANQIKWNEVDWNKVSLFSEDLY